MFKEREINLKQLSEGVRGGGLFFKPCLSMEACKELDLSTVVVL